MSSPRQVLSAAQRILLVDWPSIEVPRSLVDAGFRVFGFSPTGYSEAELVPDPPGDSADAKSLVFRPIAGAPDFIDLVNVYRPATELPAIITRHVLRLGAKTLWLHPPIQSDEAARLAAEYGLTFVEGTDIADVARQLAKK